MELRSSAFGKNEMIPTQYTCDGEGKNPPLIFLDVPEGANTLALIMDDPDVPKQVKPDGVFDHWVLFNIAPDVPGISEDSSAGLEGQNGAGKTGYVPPCPPSQFEPSTHRYIFTLYALNGELPLPAGATKEDVLKAMDGHILAQAQLIGTYKRQK